VSTTLRGRILALAEAAPSAHGEDARAAVRELLAGLESGELRAATREGGRWIVKPWIKQGILLAFRAGAIAELPRAGCLSFTDKDTLPPREASSLGSGVRLVPGGSAVRAGAHVARGVTLMPPCYVNVGAFVGEGTMVDSHALIGSCAQVGARVHVSAAAQIGGVLEPVGSLPVIVEDDVVVGGNCGLYEGVLVRERAVLGAGVILTRSTPLHDLVREVVHRAGADGVLEVPAGAVVVPGSRPASTSWGREMGLHVAAPVIVKYRDAATDARTALEEALRS
jgi:2,3,4,5-tetrahydropyridine-2-carboxylate N-succinyltransferase